MDNSHGVLTHQANDLRKMVFSVSHAEASGLIFDLAKLDTFSKSSVYFKQLSRYYPEFTYIPEEIFPRLLIICLIFGSFDPLTRGTVFFNNQVHELSKIAELVGVDFEQVVPISINTDVLLS